MQLLAGLGNTVKEEQALGESLKSQVKLMDSDPSAYLEILENISSRIGLGNKLKLFKTALDRESLWVRGLVGYDVALTWRRSPVRIRADPPLFSLILF